MADPTYTLTDGTRTIPLVYSANNQYLLRALYGSRLGPSEPAAVFLNPDDGAPQLVTLRNGNRGGFFQLTVHNKSSANPADDVADALAALRQWVDGEHCQAARAEIRFDVPAIYLNEQRDGGSVVTRHRVLYGFVDDATAHLDPTSHLNKIAYGVVVYLTLAPAGQANAWVSLDNYIQNPNFDVESSTSGQAALWTKTGTPTLSLSTSVILSGKRSQKVVATADNEGVYSGTVANASDTLVCGFAWIYLESGSGVSVELYDVTGAAVVDTETYENSSTSAIAADGKTWIRVEVSATVTSGNDVRLQVYSDGGATTFNIAMAYITLGTLTVPDGWSSYRAIYGRADTTNTNPERINHLDLWGLHGDAPALLKLGVTGSASRTVNIWAARDGHDNIATLEQWYETITVGAAFGSVVNQSDANRSGGAYYEVTTSVDDSLTYDVTAGSAALAREFHRLPRNVWVLARSSAVSKVTFKSPDGLQTATLQANNTWEMLRVYTLGGSEVNEDSTATTLSLVIASVVTSTSMTVDVDAIIVQFIDQNFFAESIGTARSIVNGDKENLYTATAAQPQDYRGSLWVVYPGQTMTRLSFLAWSGSFAHTLTETFTLDVQALPRTRRLLGANV